MNGDLTVTRLPAAASAVAGRYILGRELGSGGFGTVFEATDTLTGQRVALKRFHATDAHEAVRVRREIAALRLLRQVGVVRLLDDGEQDSGLFLVMELVAGTPFPGRPKPCAWDDIATTTHALLEILAEVHDAGVIHRDLKPSNILVDTRGTPTLLDFGLARGDRLGPAITLSGTALGTPQYLAPEQAFGQAADARSDLWAVGALLHEALTGTLPHVEDESDIGGLLVRRATQPPRPIRELRADVPEAIAAGIDALLAQRPDDRPGSARDALALLGQGRAAPRSVLPELRPGAVAAVAQTLLGEGRAIDITGPHGAGHTHLLDAVAKEAARRGFTVARTVPARAPFASLAPLIGALDERHKAGIEEMVAYCRSAALAALCDRCALFVDDYALIDPWSQRILASLGPDLPVVRSLAGPAALPVHGAASAGLTAAQRWTLDLDAVAPGPLRGAGEPAAVQYPLEPLSPAELEPIFAGPSRILHLREDAALELHRRSRGLPRAASAELARWLRLGLAERDETGVRVSRTDIERLASDSHTAVQVQAGAPVARPRGHGSIELSIAVRRALHLRDVARLVLLAGTAATRAVVARAWSDARWRLEAALDELEALGVIGAQPDGSLTLDGVVAEHLDLDPAARREVHGRIADALDRCDPRRIVHLVAAERTGEVGSAAIAAASDLEARGRQERAIAIIVDALAIARVASDVNAATRLATKLTLLALADASTIALQQALYELQPRRTVGIPDETLAPLRQLLEAATRGTRVGAPEGLPLLDNISFFADIQLATWVWSLRVRAARGESLERERSVVAEACGWAQAAGGPFAWAHQLAWVGRLAYREGNWERAAELQLRAASDPTLPFVMRLSARTNAASALIEAGRYDDAVATAREAEAEAIACRHAHFELRAAWIAHTASFRRGDDLAPDPELATLAADVGAPYMEVLWHVTEAAIHLRRGELEAMAFHAWRGCEGATPLRMDVPERLMRLLGWAADGRVPDELAPGLFQSIAGWQEPGLRIQGIAALVLAAGRVEEPWVRVAAAALQDIAPSARERRLDLMSPAESLAVVEAASAGRWDAVPGFARALVARRSAP